MNPRRSILLVIVCVVGVAWLALWALTSRATHTDLARDVERDTVSPSHALVGAPSKQQDVALAPTASERSVAPTPLVDAVDGTYVLLVRGRCVDESGAALAGVVVSCTELVTSTRVAHSRRSVRTALRVPDAHAESDADGRFELRIPTGRDEPAFVVSLLLDATDLALVARTITARLDTVVDAGTFVIPAAARVSGFVRDAAGVGIARVQVWASSFKTLTDEHGAFEFPRASRELTELRAVGAEPWQAVTESFAPPRTRTGLVLVLPTYSPESFASGRVLDPERRPVAGARILTTTRDLLDVADEDGRFQVALAAQLAPGVEFVNNALFTPATPRAARTELALRVEDAAERWPAVTIEHVVAGMHELEFVFVAAHTIEVGVRSSRGGPVRSFECRILDPDTGARVRTVTSSASSVLRLVAEPTPFLLRVEAEGHVPRTFGPFAGAEVPKSLDVVLDPLARITGRVVAAGTPVALARVWALRASDDDASTPASPPRWELFDEGEVVTDRAGTFELTYARNRPTHVAARADGYATTIVGLLELDPAVGARGVVLELVRGGTLEGIVRRADGRACPARIVRITQRDGTVRTQSSDPEGRYRFAHLSTGEWTLRLEGEPTRASEKVNWPGDHEWIGFTFEAENERTLTRDVVLSNPLAVFVTLDDELMGVAGIEVSFDVWTGEVHRDVVRTRVVGASDRGPWRIDADLATEARLVVTFGFDSSSVELVEPLAVDARHHHVSLPFATLRGRLKSPVAEGRRVALEWRASGGRVVTARAEISSSDAFTFPLAPVGDVQVTFEDRTKTVTVVPGEMTDMGEL